MFSKVISAIFTLKSQGEYCIVWESVIILSLSLPSPLIRYYIFLFYTRKLARWRLTFIDVLWHLEGILSRNRDLYLHIFSGSTELRRQFRFWLWATYLKFNPYLIKAVTVPRRLQLQPNFEPAHSELGTID